ncbi:MAG: hypothetical protein A3H27_01095 [Acidobacteria bacterium RIFCSPLOWO2_02_FULL_59_13]|nr:MAG: hypothetical protein A3H27_01095 [Acidobacteria bacterium RIFCSPLOWO2_02_FULL_59_13]
MAGGRGVGHHNLYNICSWSRETLVNVVSLFPHPPCQSETGCFLLGYGRFDPLITPRVSAADFFQ